MGAAPGDRRQPDHRPFPQAELRAGRAHRAEGRRPRRRVPGGARRRRAAVRHRSAQGRAAGRSRPGRRRPAPSCSTAAPRTTSCGPTPAVPRACSTSRPSRAMKADALAQYLVWKRWQRWFLVDGLAPRGPGAGGGLPSGRRRSSAPRSSRRRSTRIPAGRGAPTAAMSRSRRRCRSSPRTRPITTCWWWPTRAEVFGEYMPYHTWDAAAGGGHASAWCRSPGAGCTRQWGGTQLQRRFIKLAGRPMTERDYNVWVACARSARR